MPLISSSQSFCCDHQIQLMWTLQGSMAIPTPVGGFCKAGVYPFDPTFVSALKESGLSGSKSNSTDSGDSSDSSDSSSGEDPFDGDFDQGGNEKEERVFGNDLSSTPTSKEDVYQKRFEEGYDLCDPDYISWLEIHHPETVPKNRYRWLQFTSDHSSVVDDPRWFSDFSLSLMSGGHSLLGKDCDPWWFGDFSLSLKFESGGHSFLRKDCDPRWFGYFSLSLNFESSDSPGGLQLLSLTQVRVRWPPFPWKRLRPLVVRLLFSLTQVRVWWALFPWKRLRLLVARLLFSLPQVQVWWPLSPRKRLQLLVVQRLLSLPPIHI